MSVPLSPEDFARQVVTETWALFKRDALLIVVASLLAVLLSVVSFGILTGPVSIGCITIVRRRRRGEHAELGDVLQFDHFVGGLLVALLVSLAVGLGLLALVVPGLLALVFSTYCLHGVAYDDRGAVESIRDSVVLVRENFANVLVLVVALTVLNALASTLVLVALITAPLSLVAWTVSYEILAQRSEVKALEQGRREPSPG